MMMRTNDASVLRVLRVALGVITDRLLSILALAMTFGLSAWTMNDPTWERMAMAAFFATFVFIPALLHDRKGVQNHDSETERQE